MAPGAGVVASSMCIEPFAAGQRDLPPHLARERRRSLGEAAHRCQQRVRLRKPCPRQSVQVLKGQKWQYRIVGPGGEMTAEFLPARPDIDAGHFEARQQRYGADLILGVVLGDPPAMSIVEFKSFLIAPLAEIEQGQG